MAMTKTCVRPAVLALVLAAGCGKSDMPQTYPVTGTVKFTDGQPLPGGSVHFKLPSDDTLTVNGEVKEDGTFTLFTIKGNTKVPGAPEGSYQVTVQAPVVEHRMLMPPVTLSENFQVGPKENHFDIKVDRPPAR
jgi:hypothetical protein